MIARLFPASYVPVDTGGKKAFGQSGAQHEVIDTQPCIPAPRVSEIVPKGVDAFCGMQLAQGIRPALFEETVKSAPDLGTEKRIVHPSLRLIDVKVGRHHIVVAGERDRRIQGQQFACVNDQPFEPA